MAIVFKKALRKNVADQTAAAKYYPQLLTLGQSVGIDKIAYQMKENSSLSKGDILSVIANFVECMRKNLYNGHSVNIRDFGVFSLSARTEGSETEKDCTAKKIRTVRINFRPSTGVRPDLASTRAEDAMEFVDLQTYLNGQKEEEDAGGWRWTALRLCKDFALAGRPACRGGTFFCALWGGQWLFLHRSMLCVPDEKKYICPYLYK